MYIYDVSFYYNLSKINKNAKQSMPLRNNICDFNKMNIGIEIVVHSLYSIINIKYLKWYCYSLNMSRT